MAAWLGVLALCLNALTPLAPPARADIQTGICTSSGFQSAPGAPSAPSTPHERTQCSLCTHCVPASGHAAPGPGEPLLSPLPDAAPTALREAAPPFSTRWIPGARPRAPPASSPA